MCRRQGYSDRLRSLEVRRRMLRCCSAALLSSLRLTPIGSSPGAPAAWPSPRAAPCAGCPRRRGSECWPAPAPPALPGTEPWALCFSPPSEVVVWLDWHNQRTLNQFASAAQESERAWLTWARTGQRPVTGVTVAQHAGLRFWALD